MANIHYSTRILYLHEGTVALVNIDIANARNAKTVNIPGRKMCEMPVTIPRQYLSKPVMLKPVPYLEKNRLMGACCLVQTSKTKVRVPTCRLLTQMIIL